MTSNCYVEAAKLLEFFPKIPWGYYEECRRYEKRQGLETGVAWPCYYCMLPVENAGSNTHRTVMFHPECEALLRCRKGTV